MNLKSDEVKRSVRAMLGQGMSQMEVSRETGIPQSTISDFYSGITYRKWEVGDVSTIEIEFKPKEEVTCDQNVISVATTRHNPLDIEEKTHLVIPDTQCKSGIPLDYLEWAGRYIADKQPDVIVHLGDHADMPSLSSYDRGKKRAEGKRVSKDINAAIDGMNTLLAPIKSLQDAQLAEYGKILYKPVMVLTLGNHEERIDRHVEASPELSGFLSCDNLMYKGMGWEVQPFLQPKIIDGVSYVHYMANPMSGKPYGGMAMNVLKNVGESFTQGHKQTLDVATRFLPASGKQQWAIIAGAYYAHDEDYKGPQGNHHWRGLVYKHNVKDGSYNPMFVDIDYLERRYG